MQITAKDAKEFSKISGDRNQIHLSSKFSKNFFFKDPIAHGINEVLLCFSKYLKKKKSFLLFKKINIKFKNFLNINEKFHIKIFNKKIILYSKLNTKILIKFEYDYSTQSFQKNKSVRKFALKKISNKNLLSLLLLASRYVGNTNPGNGSLIHEINYNYDEQIKKKKKKFKKIRNFYHITLSENKENLEILSSKLVPFKNSKKIINKVRFKNKKILIFGPGSIFAEKVKEFFSKSKVKYINYSLRMNSNGFVKMIDKKKIFKILQNIRPDYIFYFSTPRIMQYDFKSNFIKNSFREIYINNIIYLVNLIKKFKIKTKIFFPSTNFLKKKNWDKKLDIYLNTKKEAEELFSKKNSKDIVKIYRLPKYKNTSNYNLLGFYEGEEINHFKKFILKFILSSNNKKLNK